MTPEELEFLGLTEAEPITINLDDMAEALEEHARKWRRVHSEAWLEARNTVLD